MALWAFGLFCMLYSPGLVPITPEREAAYEQGMKEADTNLDDVLGAEQQLAHAWAEEYHSKVWFWWWRSPYREIVKEKQAERAKAEADLYKVSAERNRLVAKAKSHLGLWSIKGVQEGRDLFWHTYQKGKVFAQRQTFWDALLSLGYSRDDNLLGFIFRWLGTIAFNFTIGLLGSMFVFLWSLPSVIMSFQPSFVSGVLFFAVATVSGLSMVATYLFLIYGAAAGTAYVAAKNLGGTARIGQGRRGYAPRYIRHGYGPGVHRHGFRPHYA